MTYKFTIIFPSLIITRAKKILREYGNAMMEKILLFLIFFVNIATHMEINDFKPILLAAS